MGMLPLTLHIVSHHRTKHLQSTGTTKLSSKQKHYGRYGRNINLKDYFESKKKQQDLILCLSTNKGNAEKNFLDIQHQNVENLVPFHHTLFVGEPLGQCMQVFQPLIWVGSATMQTAKYAKSQIKCIIN